MIYRIIASGLIYIFIVAVAYSSLYRKLKIDTKFEIEKFAYMVVCVVASVLWPLYLCFGVCVAIFKFADHLGELMHKD